MRLGVEFYSFYFSWKYIMMGWGGQFQIAPHITAFLLQRFDVERAASPYIRDT
jgi:phosphoheptose isomerase